MKGVLTIALPKGRVLRAVAPLLAEAGADTTVLLADDRTLVRESPAVGLRFLLLKPDDVPTYVEYGAADLGVCGRDVLIERPIEVARSLHQHVAADHAQVRRAVLHVGGHVVGLQQQEAQVGRGRLAYQGSIVDEQRRRIHARPLQQRSHDAEHPALGQGDRERSGHASAPFTRCTRAPTRLSFSSMRSYPRSMW